MQPGEGMLVVAGAVVLGLTSYVVLRGAQKLSLQWSQSVNGWSEPIDEEPAPDLLRADALVPEYAAARRAPCTCRNCRLRHTRQPCSDYDGD